jgi:hypothetical protein
LRLNEEQQGVLSQYIEQKADLRDNEQQAKDQVLASA